MANRTDTSTIKLFGSNPQYLISNIIRSKIYDSLFWKKKCFAVTAESIIDLAISLKYVGGTYGGNRKPTPFLCLVLKLLQIQPDKEIIYEYIKNEEFLYLRALGCFYFRLVGKSAEVYKYLEPVLADYRKIRVRLTDGSFEKMYMDEFVDNCLVLNNFLDVDFPSLTKRQILEENQLLQKRASDCYQEFLDSLKKERQKIEEEKEKDGEEKEEEEEEKEEAKSERKAQDKEDGLKKKKEHRTSSRSTSSFSERHTSPSKRENEKRRLRGWVKEREKGREREKDRSREREKERGREKDRSQERERERERRKQKEKEKEERKIKKDMNWHKSRDKERCKSRDKYRDRDRNRDKYYDVKRYKHSDSYKEIGRKKRSSKSKERISRRKESSSSRSRSGKAYEKRKDDKWKTKRHDAQHYAGSTKDKSGDWGDEKKDKNSVEEWNKIRSKLGMKPLK